jgi:hypothetical protein
MRAEISMVTFLIAERQGEKGIPQNILTINLHENATIYFITGHAAFILHKRIKICIRANLASG